MGMTFQRPVCFRFGQWWNRRSVDTHQRQKADGLEDVFPDRIGLFGVDDVSTIRLQDSLQHQDLLL
jgi:hypothetical protein